jgi:hypothetical protein
VGVFEGVVTGLRDCEAHLVAIELHLQVAPCPSNMWTMSRQWMLCDVGCAKI